MSGKGSAKSKNEVSPIMPLMKRFAVIGEAVN
jgi:hypothetical protein